MDIQQSIAYCLISKAYHGMLTNRSNVPLINHIDEGLLILQKIDACYDAQLAFCIHPLLQDDRALCVNWREVADRVNCRAVLLAMEYRRAANAYLCRPHTDRWTAEHAGRVIGIKTLLPEVRHMLIADKQQNQKDFMLYHAATHPRSAQLAKYFENWLWLLEAK